MKAAHGIGQTGVGPPFAAGKPPRALSGFYPLAVPLERYARLQFRARDLRFGRSQIGLSAGGVSGSSIPLAFARHYALTDERDLLYFPGACRVFGFDSGDAPQLFVDRGELHLGWLGGTPILPPPAPDGVTLNVPTVGVFPPNPARDLSFTPDFVATLEATDMESCYVDGDIVYPLLWSWFFVDSGPSMNARAYYLTHPGLVPNVADGDYTVTQTATLLTIFGWGSVPLYKLESQAGPAVSLDGNIELIVDRYFEYAKPDGSEPVWNWRTGKQIGRVTGELS